MAQQYLSIEQVCKTLGVTEDDVKKMVGDGRLREVRDAGKRLYRTEDVERIRGNEGSSIVDLSLGDQANLDETETFASALSSLADSSSSLSILDDTGSGTPGPAEAGSSISLSSSDIELDGIPESLPAKPKAPEPKKPEPKKPIASDSLSSEIALLSEDDDAGDKASLGSAEDAPELGLSGSDVIKLDQTEEVRKKSKEDTRITSSGISVFDDDELEVDTDPMGKTHIAPAVEDFDAVGSGSGLLDLTRESDDTSLGAELLDVISPTDAAETEAETAVADDAIVATVTEDSAGDSAFGEGGAAVAVAAPAAVRRSAGAIAGSTPLNVSMFLGLLGLTAIGLAAACQLVGIFPTSVLGPISSGVPYMATFLGLIVISAVLGVMSILADRR